MLVPRFWPLKTLEVPPRVNRELPNEPAGTPLQDTDAKERKENRKDLKTHAFQSPAGLSQQPRQKQPQPPAGENY